MSQVRGFFSKSVNPILFRAKLARKIENVRKEFNNVAQDMSKLNVNRSLIILKQDEFDSSSVLQSEIIGREQNKSDIVNLLKQTHPNQNVSLIVVVVGRGV
ncbi:NB-ARC domain disease resistance protein [Arachis hypogaea]|nr:NB-ARC domain disease resistance protein [Arachis hypogaea]